MKHRLSLLLFRSAVAPRSTPPLPSQRIFLLGCPVPIRQGARPFKTPREHETEPGRDVSWLPHLPVSGMVKLLSWGVTLGVLCVFVCMRVHVALGQETLPHTFEESYSHKQHADIVLLIYVTWHFDQNLNSDSLLLDQGKLTAVFIRTFWMADISRE